ncbi:hypothetical protein CY34DRAFT_183559 [Suillus luteus UH-Slu-Lm8-n1]|uniref:Uncharacterized protein n=1 Tax=Suillus luteus UH-Slu-Lm8-n1 TaxID=930992 RepID=A0A0D0BET4_9AGAM|nr:hypothetical protein CY34DRAFT_183559 [Suillus luteus UH-Slu-Lm8-n1]
MVSCEHCEALARRAPPDESARPLIYLVWPLKGVPTVVSVHASNSWIILAVPSLAKLNATKMFLFLFVQNIGADMGPSPFNPPVFTSNFCDWTSQTSKHVPSHNSTASFFEFVKK